MPGLTNMVIYRESINYFSCCSNNTVAGRRTIIFLSILGMLLSNVYVMFNVIFYEEMSADWLLFTSISGLTGDIRGFYVGMYAFAADVSSRKNF